MNTFLKRLKLVEDFSITLQVSKTEFISRLEKLVSPESKSITLFQNNSNLFNGEIGFDHLVLRPKRKYEKGNNMHMTTLTANFNGNNQTITIEGNIALNRKHFLLLFLPFLLYFVAVPIFMNILSIPMLIGISIQFLFMLGMIYFVSRRAIKLSRNFFENGLTTISKNVN